MYKFKHIIIPEITIINSYKCGQLLKMGADLDNLGSSIRMDYVPSSFVVK